MALSKRLTNTTMIAAAALVTLPIALNAVGWAASPDVPARTDADHVELVDWAFDRYQQAGLELPLDTTVVFFDTQEPCEGHQGTVRAERGNEVYVCVPDDKRARQEHVLIHELAHVWTDTTMDASVRDEFLAFRGADTWNDPSANWWDRGTEQASEVITWGLLDRDPGFQRIHDRTCERMREGYGILTGSVPINDAVGC